MSLETPGVHVYSILLKIEKKMSMKMYNEVPGKRLLKIIFDLTEETAIIPKRFI